MGRGGVRWSEAACSCMPLTEACLFWCGGLWRRRLALRWAASWRSVEARGRWGLRAAVSGARPKLAEGLPLRAGP